MLAQLFLIQLRCTNVEAGRKSTARLWSILQMSAVFGALESDCGVECWWHPSVCDDTDTGRSNHKFMEVTFADDITLAARTPAALQSMIADIVAALKPVGLSLSLEKCEWLSNQPEHIWSEIIVDGISLGHTDRFTLLGT